MSNTQQPFDWNETKIREFAEYYRKTQGNVPSELWGKDLLEEFKASRSVAVDKAEKPPLGIIPEWLWKENRYKELDEAIKRYTEAKLPVPVEWVAEHFGLKGDIQHRENCKKEKPLFTTEDSVQICEGIRYWFVNKDTLELYENIASEAGNSGISPETTKYFSTEEAAKEYILINRPLLSVNEICEWYFKENRNLESEWDYENGIKKLAQSKLNKEGDIK